ncbi:MAG: signal peptidase I [Endomicrobiaceae bacterium]|nr:signal peptidase I [Endomicrobiaceae bacterium]
MNKKHIDIARKLLKQSDNKVFAVISNSMSPLIDKGDKIVCNNINIVKIKKYSLLAFNNDLNNKTVPTVHRVIKILKTKNNIIIKTKGDINLICDKTDVTQDNIIGIVVEIIKEKKTISLNKISGKLISISLYLLSTVKNYFKFASSKTKLFFEFLIMPEKQLKYDNNLKLIHQSIITKTKDWTNAVKLNIDLLKQFINKETKICDISFEGGYCEESFNFIRQGFEVDCNKILPLVTIDKKYNFIICSKVLNLASTKAKRKEIYAFIKQILQKDGQALLSYINQKNNFITYFKRQIFSLSKLYKGPEKDDLTYNGFFVMKHLNTETIIDELNNNNFSIEKKVLSDNVVSFLLKIN